MNLTGKKVFLIGMMGVGKTTLAKKLAQISGYDFLDTDLEIERSLGKSINEIFQEDGEASFRTKEVELAHKLVSMPKSLIVSTGGGFPCNADVMPMLLKSGICVYLEASPKFISSRVYKSNSDRPLVRNSKTKSEFELKLESMLFQRLEHYSQAHLRKSAVDLDAKILWREIEAIQE